MFMHLSALFLLVKCVGKIVKIVAYLDFSRDFYLFYLMYLFLLFI